MQLKTYCNRHWSSLGVSEMTDIVSGGALTSTCSLPFGMSVGRLHNGSSVVALVSVLHGRGTCGERSDFPRERRQPGGGDARLQGGGRVALGVGQGCRHRSGWYLVAVVVSDNSGLFHVAADILGWFRKRL